MVSPPTHRSLPVRLLAVCLVFAGLVVSCTGSEEPSGATTSGPQTSAPPVTAVDAYVYTDPAGIEARVKIEGDGASLTILNDTGAVLPVPGLYVLDARDGTKVVWEVLEDAAIQDGERVVFQVDRPTVPEAKHIGLMAILFGGKDYGAFTPPHPETDA